MYLLAKSIKEVCKTHKEKTAIKFYHDGHVKLILYHQLDTAGELVAKILSSCNSKNDSHNYIALLMDVSESFPVLIQGILLSERPFVCLDVNCSEKDWTNLINRLKIELLITNRNHAVKITENFSKSKKLKEFEIFESDCEIWGTGISHDGHAEFNKFNSRLLYAIQTSGSTGEKKVVQVVEDCILPNILELRDLFKVTCTDVIYFASPITFDPSIIEIFLALTTGATLFIVSSRARAAVFPVLIDVLFPEEDTKPCITFIQTTPSIFLSWPKDMTRQRIMKRLKILALGGEKCPSWDELSEYCSPVDSLKIFNLYGITEVSCWASYCNVLPSSDCQILGTPMIEMLLQVRDCEGNVLNDGVGEMFIGSRSRICVLDDENVSEILSYAKKEPLFRATGDLVQVENDGKVFRFLSRKDRVVKRWGQKVNLAEIENVTRKNKNVSNCSCIIDEHSCLILFHQSYLSEKGNGGDIRAWLAEKGRLPNTASVPDVIVKLHALPLNSHGKIDTIQLKKMHEAKNLSLIKSSSRPIDQNSLGSHLKKLWVSCTKGCDAVVVNDEKYSSSLEDDFSSVGFISSGGTSVTAVQFISTLPDFHIKVPSELLANLLSDCTFKECCNLFELSNRCCGENSDTVVTLNKSSSASSEPMLKKKKLESNNELDNIDINYSSTLINQSNNECPLAFIKFRGKVIMYSREDNDMKALNGKEHFELSIEWKYFLNKCVDASPTVISFKNGKAIVSVGSHSGDLVYLNCDDGEVISVSHLPDRIESSLSVSSCGKYGYIGCYDGHLRCTEIKTGDILSSFATSGMIKSTSVLDNGGSIIFGSYDQHLYCITNTFQLVWKWKGNGSIYATPCLDHDKNIVYTGLLDGSCVCLEVESGNLLWMTKLSTPIFSSPLLLNSEAVIFAEVSGSINCLNAVSGSLVWTYKVEGNIFSSLTSLQDNNRTLILFGCHDNNVYCLSCIIVTNPPSLLWKTSLQSPVFATPFVDAKSGIVVAANSTGQTVFLLSLINGIVLASFKLPGEIFSSPVFHENKIVVGCRDNYLYCLHVGSICLSV